MLVVISICIVLLKINSAVYHMHLIHIYCNDRGPRDSSWLHYLFIYLGSPIFCLHATYVQRKMHWYALIMVAKQYKILWKEKKSNLSFLLFQQGFTYDVSTKLNLKVEYRLSATERKISTIGKQKSMHTGPRQSI